MFKVEIYVSANAGKIDTTKKEIRLSCLTRRMFVEFEVITRSNIVIYIAGGHHLSPANNKDKDSDTETTIVFFYFILLFLLARFFCFRLSYLVYLLHVLRLFLQ